MEPNFLKRTYKLTLIAVIFIIFSSCNLSTCNYSSDLENFDKIPELQSLIGNYKLDVNSLASVGPAELILKDDSSLILKNIPIGVLDVFNSDYEQNKESLQKITGTWKISNNGKQPILKVNLRFKNIDKELENYQTDWSLCEKNEKPIILIILGDPGFVRL